ncbi:MAG: serine hydrolase [Cyclobacteriaceae bacterium]
MDTNDRVVAMSKKLLWCGLMITLGSFNAVGQPDKAKWIDSVFSTLGQNEKLGQMFITRISSYAQPENLEIFRKRLTSENLGGVIFTSGSVDKQAQITNQFQADAKVPLIISLDASSGLGQFDSALRFPHPLAQAAVADDSMIYWISREAARQMKVMGIHMSLSPNASTINSETANEVILYGEDPISVARKSLLHMRGLQDEGILSCAKFFPLKGIEVLDEKGRPHLKLHHDSLESTAYQELFKQGLNAVIPSLIDLPKFYEPKTSDLKKKLSDSTFRNFASGNLLHQPMGFEGVVLVDVQMLQSIPENGEPGDAELFAFQAGADLIISENALDPALRKIKKLIRSEKSYAANLDKRVKKILALKYDAGLWKRKIINLDFLQTDLHTVHSQLLRHESFKQSITTLQNKNNFLPVLQLEDKNFICLIAGDTAGGKIFYDGVKKYVPANRLLITEEIPDINLAGQQVIIVALFPSTTKKNLQNVLGVLEGLETDQQIIIADFGCKIFKPYASHYPHVITGYANTGEVVRVIPQIIFGGLPSTGILPVHYGSLAPATSLKTGVLNRLTYSFPEDAGMDASTLQKIGKIAEEAILLKATPGCHVLIARAGKVIYDKSFGHLTYDKQQPVTEETMYDLASLTKVSATLQAVMFMQEKGLIDIHKKISVYLPELKGTNKKDLTIIDMLTHQSGLMPFIPLWPLTLEGVSPLPQYYNVLESINYPLQISGKLFGSNILKDSVWSWIKSSKLLEKPDRTPHAYRYSDLGFMMFKQLAERILNQPMDDFLKQNFYEPLGAYRLGYTPLKRFSSLSIAPTELDTVFRKGLLIGTVHDERAAMLGGISGHAGLFGTANDLSKLGQMLLQQGSYGGIRYYKPETVKLFTDKQFHSSRRGLGWDKPVQSEWNSPTSIFASPQTFGHTGFTGTCLWVDPEFDLVYIFVSNRVFPDRNDKLIKGNIRSRIQDVIYEAIFNYCKTSQSTY